LENFNIMRIFYLLISMDQTSNRDGGFMATQEYVVQLRKGEGERTTTARVRDAELRLGATSGDPSAGFNPAETLLSAAGACITSSFGLVARNSGITVSRFDVVVRGVRQDSPPSLVSIDYQIELESPATDDKIDRVLKIAERNSTVLSTLKRAVEVHGSWHRIQHAAQDRQT
jgi:putative redox protein